MLRRLRNLWRMSSIDIPKSPDEKTIAEKLKEVLSASRKATIVEAEEPQDMFPTHETPE